MKTPRKEPSDAASLKPLEARLLQHLLAARAAAVQYGHSVWEFALRLADFPEAGAGMALRGLIRSGLVVEGRETGPADTANRRVQQVPHLDLDERSRFIATNTAVKLAGALNEAEKQIAAGTGDAQPPTDDPKPLLPSFVVQPDGSRALVVGGEVVTTFHRPAKWEELLLTAFENNNWTPKIRNPFLKLGKKKAAQRLHEVIDRLNQKVRKRIRFRTDDSRTTVRWEPVS